MDFPVKLRSGKELTPNLGILGLSLDPENWDLFEGYDAAIEYHHEREWRKEDDDDSGFNELLSNAERQEIAALMIAKWKAWAKKGAR